MGERERYVRDAAYDQVVGITEAHDNGDPREESVRTLTVLILAFVAAAVAEEREECAKLVEQADHHSPLLAQTGADPRTRIAKAIRARTAPGKEPVHG